MTAQDVDIDWKPQGVPVSRSFEDPYYSLENGLAEARHVFLAGTGLPERFRPGFHIGELGVGTGLNLCAAYAAWRESGQSGCLRYTGFEAYPLGPDEMEMALRCFPEIRDVSDVVIAALNGDETRIDLPDLTARIIIGDARDTLPDWDGRVDAWFLDGFAPARNPELWEPGLLGNVAAHTAPGGRFATYTAAGFVRRRLEAAGFEVSRVPGFGRKRHMTLGRRP